MLIVGTDKSDIIRHLPETFLFIDDGQMIDQLTLPARRKVTNLDLTVHHFNPLRRADPLRTYQRATDFVSLINALFPEGENTLTRRSSNLVLLKALTSKHPKLENLIAPDKHHPGTMDAYEKIERVLLSPILKPFLCEPTNLSLKGIVLVRLDASIPDFDRRVIANLLIANYEGHVVITDFGFYACPFHASLIEQERLTVGLNYLDEVPKLKNALLLMPDAIGKHCTAEDAETLASHYSGFSKGTEGFATYVQSCIS